MIFYILKNDLKKKPLTEKENIKYLLVYVFAFNFFPIPQDGNEMTS